jgi:low affinity Fe/Cu permease
MASLSTTEAHPETWLAQFARTATEWTGTSTAFFVALSVVVVWLVTGPVFHYSDTWQLVINTGTTIVTFLMVFLLQRSQNQDSRAIHLKLNELVAAVRGASNRLIAAEELTEEELKILREHYRELSHLAQQSRHLRSSHSVEEAVSRHARKGCGKPE